MTTKRVRSLPRALFRVALPVLMVFAGLVWVGTSYARPHDVRSAVSVAAWLAPGALLVWAGEGLRAYRHDRLLAAGGRVERARGRRLALRAAGFGVPGLLLTAAGVAAVGETFARSGVAGSLVQNAIGIAGVVVALFGGELAYRVLFVAPPPPEPAAPSGVPA